MIHGKTIYTLPNGDKKEKVWNHGKSSIAKTELVIENENESEPINTEYAGEYLEEKMHG